ncbi:YncE family protein [Lutimonas saemankumensis]|uniref:YncE family protein n=1 Tax=Lutimonas saemankumensis TaxID=483016 RepID=UPI001CD275D0|nr:DUF5074 domain-containing protein [Lutimonas saemankumensis]MCA0931511.1 YncE family protein [Lutimonas saemankumensis]
MKKINYLFALLSLTIVFSSCSDDNDTPDEPKGDYENGYFVSNEGPFQNGSGTLTFVGNDGAVSQNVYKNVNGEDLGNIVNSMYIEGDKAYIVVNNSSRVVVVNRYTMEKEAVIDGEDINNPRHFAAGNGKGFISNWGDPFDSTDDFITVVSLESNSVLDKISVGEGPEHMIVSGNKLFVCLQGGYGTNNKVVAIDTSDNSVLENIEVGDVPESIVTDSKGYLWVLCSGNPEYTGNETAGSLNKIDPSDYTLTSMEFETVQHPSLLNSELGELFYSLDGQVYLMDEDAAELPAEAVDGLDGFFYSMLVEGGLLYATDAKNYASEGDLKVFDIKSGTSLETIVTGIVPGQVVIP